MPGGPLERRESTGMRILHVIRSEVVQVERLVHGGAGLVRTAAGVAFVEGVLPGEVVTIGPVHRRGGRPVAEVESIEHLAPARREPRCPLVGRCGGCSWQHINYATQGWWKRAMLSENLARIAGVDLAPEAIELVSGEEWGYRRRIQLHRDADGVIGFARRGSRSIIEVPHCAVASQRINAELARLHARRGALPARGSRTIAVDDQNGVQWADRHVAAELSILGVPFRFSPAAFAQANHALLAPLAERIGAMCRTAPRGTHRLVDLYAGAGLLAVMAVAHAVPEEVVCVEPQRENAVYIAANMAAVGYRGTVTVLPTTAERALATKSGGGASGGGVSTTVLLDPPRRGLGKAVRKALLADHAIQRIIYLSCEAAALARDIGALKGVYTPTRVTIFDFYPQTPHIESLVVLDRGDSGGATA